VLHCLLSAYLPLAYGRVVRSANQAAIGVGSDDTQGDLRPPAAVRAVAIAVGLASAFYGPYLMEPTLGSPLHWWFPSQWNGASVWHRVLGLWVSPWAVLFTCAVLWASVRLSRLARGVTLRDPFDRAPVMPFAGPALTNAGLAMGLLSLFATFALDFGAARPVLFNGGLAVVLVLVALLLPTAGVRARVREAKDGELAWCDAAVERERRSLRADGDAGAVPGREVGGRLADLLAYRTLVDRVNEWPFDNPALRRILLYLLLPLGSWVASSIVQHAVEKVLPK
jgi:hypothetical protein